MKRKIEFRGKRIDGAGWVYGFYHEKALPLQCIKTPKDKEEEPKGFIIYPGFADWNMPRPMYESEVVPETVGQYTGIKDKDGKEIYEGDLVHIENMLTSAEDPLDGVVVYDEGSWWVVNKEQLKGARLWGEGNYIRIRGNIYENPELLEG